MAKPFSIQAPEDIAKEYAGNKQRIAQAAQMGIVDPTAAVLAGMFIDRMRGAQTQEGTNPPTVAQQVMGGAPSAPSAPSPATGGLGTTPQAAPPMAPMPAPQAPQAAQGPMGMAAGGIAGLPVPGAMFDEPDNGGYAGGGLVAFADGGGIDADRLRRAFLMQESSGDYGALNEGSGALGGYQFMPDTARALAKRLGVAYRPELMTGAGGRSAEGKAYQERLMDAQMKDILAFAGDDVGRAGTYHFAGPNEEGWGPKTRQYQQDIIRRYSGSKDMGEIPERNIGTAAGRMGSLEDILAAVQGINRKSPEEIAAESRVRARFEERSSDEYYEGQRKADMWQTLAEVGFNMASSKSPYVLQAIGEAAAAAMPGARADKKERKEAQDRALEGLMALGARDRKEAMEGLRVAIPVWQAGIEAEEFERSLEQKELDRQHDFEVLDRKIGAELTAAGIAASSKERDIYSQAAAARLAEKRRLNERLPAYKPGMQPGTYKRADSVLVDEALSEILEIKKPSTSLVPGMEGAEGTRAGANPAGGVSFSQLPQ